MAGFRVGIADPIIAAQPAVDTFTRANSPSAVVSRVDSFWVPDHLNALFPRSPRNPKYCGGAKILPSADAYLEPWTMLGHIAARNRVGRLRLGVAVTDTGRRNPAVTAQAAATLHLLTKGRAILGIGIGIGTGEREAYEPYGVDWSKPVARFDEAMATIRALWDSKGALVNRDSAYFPLHDAIFDLPPCRRKWPEIWVAAHGPRMLRAAGRYADGYFPAFAHTPQEYAQRLEGGPHRSVERGTGSDGHDSGVAHVRGHGSQPRRGRRGVGVGGHQGGRPERLRCVLSRYGAQHPLGAGFTGAQDLLPQDMDEQTALSRPARPSPPAPCGATTVSATWC